VSVVFLIAVALLSIVLTIAFDRMVVKPVHRVSDALSNIAAGDFDSRILLSTHDEMATLANAVNRMATELKRTTVSRNALDREVRERRGAQAQLEKARETAEAALLLLIRKLLHAFFFALSVNDASILSVFCY